MAASASSILSRCFVFTLCAGAVAWVAFTEGGITLNTLPKNEFSASVSLEALPASVQEGNSAGAISSAAVIREGRNADLGEGKAVPQPLLSSDTGASAGGDASPSAEVASLEKLASELAEAEAASRDRETADAGGTLFEAGPAGASATAYEVATSEKAEAHQSISPASSAQASSSGESGRITAERSALAVSAALSTAPPAVDADGNASGMAFLEQAIAGTGIVHEGGQEVSGRVLEDAPRPEEKRQDSVVTGDFVQDLSRLMAEKYVPSRREGKPGRTSLTLSTANERYSCSRTLRSLESDPMKARASVIRYVFQPNMLEVLYQMYAADLADALESAARRPRKGGALDDAEVADMFAVYADQFRRTASSLKAASMVDIRSMTRAVRRAIEAEAAANEDFARAYTAHMLAREEGRTHEAKMQSSIMVEHARVASMYAGRQEQARKVLASALQKAAERPALNEREALFLGEWLGRHNISSASAECAADICRRMAELLEKRGRSILGLGADVSPQPEPADTHIVRDEVSETPDANEMMPPLPADVLKASPAESETSPAVDEGAGRKAGAALAGASMQEISGRVSDVRPPAPMGTVTELLKAMENKAVSEPVPVIHSALR